MFSAHYTRSTVVETCQELLSRQLPFYSIMDDLKAMFAIISGQLPSCPEGLERRSALDQRLWELCKICWTKDVQRRPAMSQVLSVLVTLDCSTVSISQEISHVQQLTRGSVRGFGYECSDR